MSCDVCPIKHKPIGFYNRDEVFADRYELGLKIKQGEYSSTLVIRETQLGIPAMVFEQEVKS
jgi:hypothetical protein